MSESKSIYAGWIENKKKKKDPAKKRKEKVHQHQRRLADDIEQPRTGRILYIKDIVFISSILYTI